MKKIKQAIYWIKNKLTDPLNWKIFIFVFLVMSSPVIVGFILGFIFDSPVLTGIATGWLVLWNVVPCTPFIGTCLFITLGIRKICNYITIKIRRDMYGS